MFAAAVDALFFALDQHPALDPGGRILFLRARHRAGLERLAERMTLEQTWRPLFDEFTGSSWTWENELDEGGVPIHAAGGFSAVWVLPWRQREQVLFDLARGWEALAPEGTLVVSLPNDWGAARFEKLLRGCVAEVTCLSKHHCRVFWVKKTAGSPESLPAEWLEMGRLRSVAETGFVSAPGLFGWDKIDRGSQLLTGHLPAILRGRVADLGAGWGYLSHFLLSRHPHLKVLTLFEADAVALAAARANLAPLQTDCAVNFVWHDVMAGLPSGNFDAVVMNPPFHEGRAADPLLGHRFLGAGIAALRSGGKLWAVANQNLPYERFLREALPDARMVVQQDGFKVLTGTRPKPQFRQ